MDGSSTSSVFQTHIIHYYYFKLLGMSNYYMLRKAGKCESNGGSIGINNERHTKNS